MNCPNCQKELPTVEILAIMYNWYKERIHIMEIENRDIYDNEHYELMKQFCKEYELEQQSQPKNEVSNHKDFECDDYDVQLWDCQSCKKAYEIGDKRLYYKCRQTIQKLDGKTITKGDE